MVETTCAPYWRATPASPSVTGMENVAGVFIVVVTAGTGSMNAGWSEVDGVKLVIWTPSDGVLDPSLAVSVTAVLLLAEIVTLAVSPTVAGLPGLSITRPYCVSGTMVIESMIGGFNGLLSSPLLLVVTGTLEIAWRRLSPETRSPMIV